MIKHALIGLGWYRKFAIFSVYDKKREFYGLKNASDQSEITTQ